MVLTGANSFMIQQKLQGLKSAFIAEQGDFGIEMIEAGDVEFGRLLETVSSLPFLSARRMVIVRDLHANKILQEKIEQLLDSVSDTTDLVMVEPKFDKRSSLYKTLKKRTEFHEFTELDERQLAAWLVQEARARGGELKPNDVQLIINRAGTNQMSLSNELDKLLSFDSNITRQTIELLVEPLPGSTVFELLDAAFAGRRTAAFELFADQRKQQVEPQAIMGMIAWQMHVLAVVKFNENSSPEEIAKSAKLNPFVVRKSLGLVRGKQLSEVKDLVSRAVTLDARLKSENLDAEEAVQHFILTI